MGEVAVSRVVCERGFGGFLEILSVFLAVLEVLVIFRVVFWRVF